jgi:hypothetical protein
LLRDRDRQDNEKFEALRRKLDTSRKPVLTLLDSDEVLLPQFGVTAVKLSNLNLKACHAANFKDSDT